MGQRRNALYPEPAPLRENTVTGLEYDYLVALDLGGSRRNPVGRGMIIISAGSVFGPTGPRRTPLLLLQSAAGTDSVSTGCRWLSYSCTSFP